MKKTYLLKNLSLSLLDSAKPNQLIILPRRFSIKKLRERVVEKNGVLFDIDIFTFDDLLSTAKNEILKERKFISREQEILIVFNLLKQIFKGQKDFENVLTYEFVSQVLHLLNLMFLESRDYPSLPSSISFEKYDWLKLLFERYKEYLDHNNLVNFSYLQDLAIGLYEDEKIEFKKYDSAKIAFFIDFRSDQKRLLKLLSRKLSSIEIFLPYFDDVELCHENVKFLEALGFDIIFGFPSTSMSDIAKDTYGSEKTSLKAFSYGNISLEVNALVKELKKDCIEGRIDFSKAAVVVPNINRYKDILAKSFQEELLPINLDYQKSLLEFGFIKFVLDLIEFLGSEFDKKKFESLVTHRFLNKEEADFEILFEKIKDIYIIDFDQIGSVLEELEFLLSIFSFDEEKENLVKIQRVYNRIRRIKKDYETSPKPYSSWLLQTKKVFERLGITKTAEFVNDIEFLKAFYALNEVFENGCKNSSEFQFDYTFEEFLDIFKMILSQKMVDVSIKILNGIDILLPQDAIGSDYEKVYFIGLSDDIFPGAKLEDFLMNNQIKLELGLDEIKDFDYNFQKELISFRSILNSYEVYMSYPRFYQQDLGKSPFLELEGIDIVEIENNYLPDREIVTHKEYKLIKNANKVSKSQDEKSIHVPEIVQLKDRELIYLYECPLKFAFKKFYVDQIKDDDSFFSSNLGLLYISIQKILYCDQPQETYNFILQNLRYTANDIVKRKSAENILEIAIEIAEGMFKNGVKEFIPQNIGQHNLLIRQNFEGFEVQLFPNFAIKVGDEEIFGFVKAKHSNKWNEIDKLWLAKNVFNLEKIAAIFLYESPRFVIYENSSQEGIDRQSQERLKTLKDLLQRLHDPELYQKTLPVKNCFRCEYNHVCILY
ncbi:hypothetical protein Csac_1167 [Caldicellulosiruptor saccharolyticus DSM 8903]|uniref:PD-(D/E)XK endonuclease-like domain-containing protein n=1 Tax=Caldicellulosiruptor saccharolyticus (strain ATCC 43494 / DSM 8903 / Tp8T 6331) TaxID=351627 RepID=A4XIN7_CALS8|nr:3'-5' exonuclease [Caldicellulosiruptor saccharolyticus]ABP66772.1 hypothetical protein Csac_1167 [Caldicellulosiruptor saccharolyticus DSM 8903]